MTILLPLFRNGLERQDEGMWNIDLLGDMVRMERARRVREVEHPRPVMRRRRRDGRVPAAEVTVMRRGPDPLPCADCAEAA